MQCSDRFQTNMNRAINGCPGGLQNSDYMKGFVAMLEQIRAAHTVTEGD